MPCFFLMCTNPRQNEPAPKKTKSIKNIKTETKIHVVLSPESKPFKLRSVPHFSPRYNSKKTWFLPFFSFRSMRKKQKPRSMHLFSPNLDQRKDWNRDPCRFLTEIKQKTSDPCRFFNRDQTEKIWNQDPCRFCLPKSSKKNLKPRSMPFFFTEIKQKNLIHARFFSEIKQKKIWNQDPCRFF